MGEFDKFFDELRPNHERNWSSDFKHENGNYANQCCMCKKYFYGHKRRVICWLCYHSETIRDSMSHPYGLGETSND